MQLQSSILQFADAPGSLDEIQEHFHRQGWTDGLPIIPPTRDRVEAVLAAAGGPPDAVVGRLLPSMAPITVEKIAINAVMAGCRPEYMPVVLAALAAVADPQFPLLPVGTNPCTPLILVNGPIRLQLGMASGDNALGGEARANSAIGRAVRLVMRNMGQGGGLRIRDRSTHGQPGRYSLCLAENEEASPWGPFHVTRGFPPSASTVTALSAVSLINVMDQDSRSGEGLLTTIARSILIPGSNNMYKDPGEVVLLISPQHAALLHRTGFDRAGVQRFLFQHCVLSTDQYSADAVTALQLEGLARDGCLRPVRRPEDFLMAVVGGPGGAHSVYVTTFGHPPQAITRAIPSGGRE